MGAFLLTNLIVFSAYYLVSYRLILNSQTHLPQVCQLNGNGQATPGLPVSPNDGGQMGAPYAHDPLYEKLGQIFLSEDKVDFTAFGAKESDVITASEVMVS